MYKNQDSLDQRKISALNIPKIFFIHIKIRNVFISNYNVCLQYR